MVSSWGRTTLVVLLLCYLLLVPLLLDGSQLVEGPPSTLDDQTE